MKDTTSSIEGIDGMKYWGSKFTKRDITVSFAFKGLDEDDLRRLRAAFKADDIHDLIFDEAPNKIYSAKVTGQAILKYLPFEDETIYNGEGSITFTCYCPYAHSELFSIYPNSNSIIINNNGDIDMPIRLWYNIYWASIQNPFSTTITYNMQTLSINNLVRWQNESPTRAGADTWILIDTGENRIEGHDNTPENPDSSTMGTVLRPTGRLYDMYMTGIYFLLPKGQSTITFTEVPHRIDYQYLYL